MDIIGVNYGHCETLLTQLGHVLDKVKAEQKEAKEALTKTNELENGYSSSGIIEDIQKQISS